MRKWRKEERGEREILNSNFDFQTSCFSNLQNQIVSLLYEKEWSITVVFWLEIGRNSSTWFIHTGANSSSRDKIEAQIETTISITVTIAITILDSTVPAASPQPQQIMFTLLSPWSLYSQYISFVIIIIYWLLANVLQRNWSPFWIGGWSFRAREE